MDCVLPLMADEDNEKDEQVVLDAELLPRTFFCGLSVFNILNLASGGLLRGCGACPPELSVRASVAFATLVDIDFDCAECGTCASPYGGSCTNTG